MPVDFKLSISGFSSAMERLGRRPTAPTTDPAPEPAPGNASSTEAPSPANLRQRFLRGLARNNADAMRRDRTPAEHAAEATESRHISTLPPEISDRILSMVRPMDREQFGMAGRDAAKRVRHFREHANTLEELRVHDEVRLLQLAEQTSHSITSGLAISADNAHARALLANVLNSSPTVRLDLRQIAPEQYPLVFEATSRSRILKNLFLDGADMPYRHLQHLLDALPHLGSPARSAVRVDFSRSELDASDAAILFGHLRRMPVTSIRLEQCAIRDEGAKALARLLPDIPVTELSVRRTGISPNGAVPLIRALPDSIATLDLSENSIHDAGAMALATNMPRLSLEKLNLAYCEIHQHGMHAVFESLTKSAVASLDASLNAIDDDTARQIGDTLPHTMLTSLKLKACHLDKGRITSISRGLRNSWIEELDLNVNHFGSAGLRALSSSLRGSPVRTLLLVNNSIGVSGIRELARQLPHTSLEHLDLSSNRLSRSTISSWIRSPAVDEIGPHIARSRLRSLTMDKTSLDDRDIAAFLPALQGACLKSVSLAHNRIGVRGMERLLSASKDTSARSLNLTGNHIGPISEHAMQRLARHLNDSSFQYIDLTNTAISSDAILTLRQSAPSTILLVNPA